MRLSPAFVLVYDDLGQVLAPVRRQLTVLSAVSGGALLVFILIGLTIADRRIVYPMKVLQNVARSIAARAHLNIAPEAVRVPRAPGQPPPDLEVDSATLIRNAETIRSVNEIQHFAEDFALMARRVLNYHQQLEREIETKTEEIQRDLDLAREFQEALMPSTYPQIPPPRSRDPVRLTFSHIYRPAFLVGGDFFDVIGISDHCAGVLVADVVGHGARSALVTAILRALIRDAEEYADAPGEFLTVINRRFYEIMPHDSECVFATLFYLVIDTRARQARFASAGHPSPLLADRNTGTVRDLATGQDRGPALGLFVDATYQTYTRGVVAGHVVVLCTDGLFEARNTQDEEFGRNRIRKILAENLDKNGAGMTRDVMHGWHQFMDTAMAEDDICLVAVELLEQERPTQPDPTDTAGGTPNRLISG